MNRRKLFSFLPLAPVLASAALIKEAQADEKPSDDKQLLSLNINNKYLHMSIGNDGNLWLKAANNDWKRVITE